jgi:6-phosphogluconolactonase
MNSTRRDAFKLLALPLALGAAVRHAPAAAAESLHTDKVLTITNSAAGNELVVLAPDDHGGLMQRIAVSAGGAGSGGGLGSQGAVTLSGDGRYAFAVNAGSNTLATFVLGAHDVRLASVVDSRGLRPISVTERDGIVVVLNDMGDGNVAAFRNDQGVLTAIAGALRPLSGNGTAPAQVSFSADGDTLVVTEKGTNRLVTYRAGADGSIGAPHVTASAGQVPFGFAFDRRNRLFVSEAAGTASSYRLDGPLPKVLSAAVQTTQNAPCWVAVTANGRYAYTANTASDSISSFRIARSGHISLIAAVAAAVGDGTTPVDLAVSAGGGRLYLLDRGNVDRVVVYDIDPDGALTRAGTSGALPGSVVGIAAN